MSGGKPIFLTCIFLQALLLRLRASQTKQFAQAGSAQGWEGGLAPLFKVLPDWFSQNCIR
jgi:hypothetical protein